jgi:hypothetical protein
MANKTLQPRIVLWFDYVVNDAVLVNIVRSFRQSTCTTIFCLQCLILCVHNCGNFVVVLFNFHCSHDVYARTCLLRLMLEIRFSYHQSLLLY